MSITHKFTIESITIVAAVLILALVFSGMISERIVPEIGKPMSTEKGMERDQGDTSAIFRTKQNGK